MIGRSSPGSRGDVQHVPGSGGSRPGRTDGGRAVVLDDIGLDRVDVAARSRGRAVRGDEDDVRSIARTAMVRANAARSIASSIASARGVPSTTFNPTASAPLRTAAAMPSRVVIPQTFTYGRRATLAGSSG